MVCVALGVVWGVLPNNTPSFVALLFPGGMGAATYALGYYVGNWCALLVPAASFVAIEVAVAAEAGSESGAAVVFWVVWLLFIPVVLLLKLGIKERR